MTKRKQKPPTHLLFSRPNKDADKGPFEPKLHIISLTVEQQKRGVWTVICQHSGPTPPPEATQWISPLCHSEFGSDYSALKQIKIKTERAGWAPYMQTEDDGER